MPLDSPGCIKHVQHIIIIFMPFHFMPLSLSFQTGFSKSHYLTQKILPLPIDPWLSLQFRNFLSYHFLYFIHAYSDVEVVHRHLP